MNIFDLTRGMFDLTATRTQPVVILPAPKFTSQPQAVVLYQRGALLSITGANTDTATDYQWQKRGTDGKWSDVSGRTGKSFSKASGAAGDNGVYRLKATNGNSAAAYSNLVYVYDVFLFIQNDSSSDPAGAGVLPGADYYHWIEDGPTGTRYYSAFLRFAATQSLPSGVQVPENTVLDDKAVAELGFSSGRMIATWATSNSAVVNIASVSGTGQAYCGVKVGKAALTAKFQNLTSQLDVNVAAA